MMLLGSLVNMLAIFAGCFVGVTLGRFIPERFNSAIEKGIALCVFYIGLDGVLAGSDTLVAILSMVLGVILGELLDLDGRIHALGDWVERRFAKKQSKTSISEGFVNASLLFCVGAMAIMGALDSGLTGDHATLYAKSTLDGITSIVYGSTMGAGVALSGVAVFLYQGLITLCASFIAPFLSDVVIAEMKCVGSLLIIGLSFNMLGMTKKLTFDRMIPPHGLEVTYDKTVHIIFPAEVRYVDLGSPDLIAGKADGAENVIRVKATVRNFPNETNMSVITEDGSFYTFNVKYAAEPLLLNVEMCDFIHDGESVNRPNNAQEIYLKELGSESPMLVRLIMKSIHKQNKREVKHIGSKRFGIQYLLKGIYTHNGLLYFHTEIKNQSNVPFDVDYITWKIVDKKVAKRTAVQEQIILPLRAQNYATCVPGKKSERTVFTMAKFTIPDDKCLVVELSEKNGGRHQSFVIENEDLVRANTIDELQVR